MHHKGYNLSFRSRESPVTTDTPDLSINTWSFPLLVEMEVAADQISFITSACLIPGGSEGN